MCIKMHSFSRNYELFSEKFSQIDDSWYSKTLHSHIESWTIVPREMLPDPEKDQSWIVNRCYDMLDLAEYGGCKFHTMDDLRIERPMYSYPMT